MMRRSFGGGDGVGNRGGGMLKTVHRAVRAGGGAAQESLSHSTTSPPPAAGNTTPPRQSYKPKTLNTLYVSNSSSTTATKSLPFFNPFHLPINSSCASDSEFDEEWEYIDSDLVDANDVGLYCDDHLVFGHVPSVDEVQHAVSSLHQVLDPVSFSQYKTDNAAYDSEKDLPDQISSPISFVHRVPSYGSEIDWMEPSLPLCNARLLKKPCGSDRLYDAFHLLQTEPSVQRMVLSLSSDKAVWDAVMNNEAVRELKQSIAEAENNVDSGSVSSDDSDDSKASIDTLSWIFVNMKAKFMDLIDRITKMVDGLFVAPENDKKTEQLSNSFEENLRTSFMLSVVVFLIVVVTRASKA